MRAYMVCSRFAGPSEGAMLVFANSGREAKVMGWKELPEMFGDEFTDVAVKWMRKDHYFAWAESDEPHVVEWPRSCKSCEMWGAIVTHRGVCSNCDGPSGYEPSFIIRMLGEQIIANGLLMELTEILKQKDHRLRQSEFHGFWKALPDEYKEILFRTFQALITSLSQFLASLVIGSVVPLAERIGEIILNEPEIGYYQDEVENWYRSQQQARIG